MPRNVALLCLDTVRKDYFDEYADQLTAQADTVFEQCRAASCWSVPSHASLITGQLPHEHNVHAHQPQFDTLAPTETLRSDLPNHQFIGVSANIYAGSAYGFDTLFDEFIDISRDHRYVDGFDISSYLANLSGAGLTRYFDVLRESLTHSQPMRSLLNTAAFQLDHWTRHGLFSGLPALFDDGAASVHRAALDRIQNRDNEEPFFLFTNVMEAHEPHRDTRHFDSSTYSVPMGWDSTDLEMWDAVNPTDDVETALRRYRDLYGASIEYLDRSVSTFIERLRDVTDRETTVIVTADHGENLAQPTDDGHLGHVASLTEGVLHVPLLVINPPAGYSPTTDSYVSHLELRRLIAGFAHGEQPSITSTSIPAEVIDITPGNESLCTTDSDYWTRSIRCVYNGDTKYEWDDRGVTSCVELDPKRSCWQRRQWQKETDQDELPDWIHDYFSVSVEDAGVQDDQTPSGESLDDDVRRRSHQLGYRQ